jgi:hypothetical protein
VTAFSYRACGVTFASEIEFPELPPAADAPDVQIRRGRVPEQIEVVRAGGPFFEVGPDNYVLRVEGVGQYWVRHGREVIVDPEPSAAPRTVRTFFLGSVLTALLHQRGLLVLHAGGVAGPHGAVLVAGHSGRGKSTLLAALARRGYPVLADDAAAINLNDDRRPVVYPAFPELRLWSDALARLGQPTEALTATRAGIQKFSWPVDDLPGEAHPLAAIYVLDTWNDAKVAVRTLSGRDRFTALRLQTRNLRVLEGLRMQTHHFSVTTAVAAAVPVIEVVRPAQGDSVERVADLVEQDFARRVS